MPDWYYTFPLQYAILTQNSEPCPTTLSGKNVVKQNIKLNYYFYTTTIRFFPFSVWKLMKAILA